MAAQRSSRRVLRDWTTLAGPLSLAERASDLPEVFRYFAEGLQDYCILKLAEGRIAAPRKSDGSGVGLMARHGFRSPYGCPFGRTFQRRARS